MKRKPTLYEQALIEEKRRHLKIFGSFDYNPKKKISEQMAPLFPNIKWEPEQLEYIDARQFLTWYLGGYKSGKTFTGCAVDIWLAQVNRPYPGMLVHPTMDGNEITIIPAFDEICELNKIFFTVKKLRSKFILEFKFGDKLNDYGHLILASGDVPKSLKGPKLAFGHGDEPLIMKEEITEILISRLAEKRAPYRRLQFTGTPEPEHMQWGFDIVDKEHEDSAARFITTISTRIVAKHLADGYIEEMEKNLSPERIQTFIDGKYRNLSQGKVYSSFEKKKNVRPTEEVKRFMIEKDNELVISFDFNVNQMSAALHRLSGTYKLLEKEFRIQSRSDTREMCILIINRLREDGYVREDGYTKFGKSFIITGDASGKAHSTKGSKSDYEIIIQMFESAGLKISVYVPDANPAVRDRTNYINMQFENETYIIADECVVNIRDRELMSWVLGANGFKIDKSKKELSHAGDSSDYGLYNTQVLTQDPGNVIGVQSTMRGRR